MIIGCQAYKIVSLLLFGLCFVGNTHLCRHKNHETNEMIYILYDAVHRMGERYLPCDALCILHTLTDTECTHSSISPSLFVAYELSKRFRSNAIQSLIVNIFSFFSGVTHLNGSTSEHFLAIQKREDMKKMCKSLFKRKFCKRIWLFWDMNSRWMLVAHI